MKLMKRNLFLLLIAFYALSLLTACSDRRATGASKGIDSTLTGEYVSKISLQEPERALALIDTMEMRKKVSPYTINYYALLFISMDSPITKWHIIMANKH